MTQRAVVNDGIHVKALGDGVVLLDFGRGDYFALDEVGAFIWERLQAGTTFELVGAAVADAFEVDALAAIRDVRQLAAELEQRGLVRIVAADR